MFVWAIFECSHKPYSVVLSLPVSGKAGDKGKTDNEIDNNDEDSEDGEDEDGEDLEDNENDEELD